MNFRFKLSQRLARLRQASALALTAALFVGCEFERAVQNVLPDPITHIALSPPTAAIQANGATDFIAAGLTATGDTGSVRLTWAATGGVIEDSSTSGLRHYARFRAGPTPGTYEVTARDTGSVTAAAAVNVMPAAVATVEVSPPGAAVAVGRTVQLAATTRDGAGNVLVGRTVGWSSSNASVATVNGSGLVTAVAVGSATITATSEGVSGTAALTVTSDPVSSVDVTPSTATIDVGQAVQLTATPRDAAGNALTGRAVSWTSSNTSMATVNASGRVTGVAAGSVTITATSEGVSGTASVTVTFVPVASVDVTPSTATLDVGQTVQLTATPRDAAGNALAGRSVAWTSGNTAVATVNSSGRVTGVAAGSAVIKATSEGVNGAATVTVTAVPVASVTVSPPTATVAVGSTVQLTATPRDAAGNALAGRAVSWSSGNTAMATVSSTGRVTGVTAGSVTITATSEGVSGTAAVTVTTGLQGTYYVSPSGSDANPGTEAAPFRTIQKAADLVNPGDVVIVEDGVYTDTDGDSSVVAVRRGGTSSAMVTFRARNKWSAKLDGVNGTAARGFDFKNGVGYVRIEGFEIYGVANVGSPVTGRGSASGISLYAGGHDSEIVGNHIHDVGRVCTLSTNTNGQVAIFVQQPNVIIEQNLVHDIGRFFPGENGCTYSGGFFGWRTLDHGVYLNSNTPGANGAIIRNNIFYNTRHGWGVQFYSGDLTNINVVNNTFAFGNPNHNYTHITLHATITNSNIMNNIFYNPEGGRTMQAPVFSGSLTVSNNITSGTAMTDVSTPAGMTLVDNLLNTDARLVDAPRDFHLQTGSPAIDFGLTLALVLIDFDGRTRPRGAAYDVGAYEY